MLFLLSPAQEGPFGVHKTLNPRGANLRGGLEVKPGELIVLIGCRYVLHSIPVSYNRVPTAHARPQPGLSPIFEALAKGLNAVLQPR